MTERTEAAVGFGLGGRVFLTFVIVAGLIAIGASVYRLHTQAD